MGVKIAVATNFFLVSDIVVKFAAENIAIS